MSNSNITPLNAKEQTSTASSPEPSVAQENDLLDSDEAAKFLGLKSSHTLEVWRSTKRYPELEYIKIGRLVRYRRKALERFILSRTVCAAE